MVTVVPIHATIKADFFISVFINFAKTLIFL